MNYPYFRVLSASLVIAACGPDGGSTTESGASTGGPTATEPDPTTTVTTGEPTTGEPQPVLCESGVGDHAGATCPGGACPIEVDVELHCDDYIFGAPGMRVAPAPDTTWVVTSGHTDSMLFRADPGGAERITGVVEPYPRTRFLLALDPGGAPHLAVDGTIPDELDDYAGGLLHITREGDVWNETLIFDAPESYSSPIDLAVDDAGRPHLFFVGSPPAMFSAAVRDGGTWTTHEVPAPDPGAWNRFALTAAGQEIAYAVPDGKLRALVEGETVEFGPPQALFVEYRPANAAPVGPDLAAAVEIDDGVAVAWASLGAEPAAGEVQIAGITPPQWTCVGPPSGSDPNMSCPGPCHETAVGTESGDFAFARTADGLGWLAWVVTRSDMLISYELDTFGDTDYFCRATIESDATTAELHLARVPLGAGAPEEVLVLPLPQELDKHELFGGTPAALAIELGAFGDDLAVGLRLRGEEDEPFLRVLRLDTAGFE